MTTANTHTDPQTDRAIVSRDGRLHRLELLYDKADSGNQHSNMSQTPEMRNVTR